jgi:hypothetical protein
VNRLTLLEVVLLSAWLGAAILVAAVVAPAAFKVLPTRTLAGALVGQVLPVIFLSGLALAVVGAAIEMRASPNTHWIPIASLVVMAVACLLAQFVIGARIETVRAAIGGAVDSLSTDDPRRIQFGRLHAYSVLSMGIGMLGAGGVLLTKFFSKST